MHPLTHGNLAAAVKDAEKLKRALRSQDIKGAIDMLESIADLVNNAIEIELMAQQGKGYPK